MSRNRLLLKSLLRQQTEDAYVRILSQLELINYEGTKLIRIDDQHIGVLGDKFAIYKSDLLSQLMKAGDFDEVIEQLSRL